MNYGSINANRRRWTDSREFGQAQQEVIWAHQIVRLTGCSWTDALKSAKRIYEQRAAS